MHENVFYVCPSDTVRSGTPVPKPGGNKLNEKQAAIKKQTNKNNDNSSRTRQGKPKKQIVTTLKPHLRSRGNKITIQYVVTANSVQKAKTKTKKLGRTKPFTFVRK